MNSFPILDYTCDNVSSDALSEHGIPIISSFQKCNNDPSFGVRRPAKDHHEGGRRGPEQTRVSGWFAGPGRKLRALGIGSRVWQSGREKSPGASPPFPAVEGSGNANPQARRRGRTIEWSSGPSTRYLRRSACCQQSESTPTGTGSRIRSPP